VNSIYLKNDCTRERQQGLSCTVLLPQPQPTSVELQDLARIRLPARAASSLLCWDLTPLVEVVLENTTTTQRNAAFSARTIFAVRSAVLEDPTIVNPRTGLPYNGEIRLNMVPYSESLTLPPGYRNSKGFHLTRSCGQAVVSKRALMTSHGLTQAQANSFFNNPIEVVLGASMDANVVTSASYNFNLRLYGDRR
jgi:hypothetical protein